MKTLQLGAINLQTGVYTRPIAANKLEKYICPDKSCSKPVIFKSGDINIHHFSHYPDDKCSFYVYHDSESSRHLHVKETIKDLINTNRISTIIRKCNSCGLNKTEKFIYVDNGYADTEKRMEFNGEIIIPDIAYFDSKNNLNCIIEVFHTHKTKSEKRPDPWYEIDTEEFIEDFDETTATVELKSISSYICNGCRDNNIAPILFELSSNQCNECEGFGIFKSSKVSPRLCINCTCCFNNYSNDPNSCGKCKFLVERAREYTELLNILKELNSLCKDLKISKKSLEKTYGISYGNISKWNHNLYSITREKISQDIEKLRPK